MFFLLKKYRYISGVYFVLIDLVVSTEKLVIILLGDRLKIEN